MPNSQKFGVCPNAGACSRGDSGAQMPLLEADTDPRCGECGTPLRSVQTAERPVSRIATPALVGGGAALLACCIFGAWWLLRTPKENAAEMGGVAAPADSTPGAVSPVAVADGPTAPTLSLSVSDVGQLAGTVGINFSHQPSANLPIERLELQGQPTWLKVDGTTLKGTPDQSGRYVFELSAIAGSLRASQQVVLLVGDQVLHTPTIAPGQRIEGVIGQSLNWTLQATHADRMTLASGSALPGGLEVRQDAREVLGIPTEECARSIVVVISNQKAETQADIPIKIALRKEDEAVIRRACTSLLTELANLDSIRAKRATDEQLRAKRANSTNPRDREFVELADKQIQASRNQEDVLFVRLGESLGEVHALGKPFHKSVERIVTEIGGKQASVAKAVMSQYLLSEQRPSAESIRTIVDEAIRSDQ
jgi:hypothetical protein